jgi:hypothetical protein
MEAMMHFSLTLALRDTPIFCLGAAAGSSEGVTDGLMVADSKEIDA